MENNTQLKDKKLNRQDSSTRHIAKVSLSAKLKSNMAQRLCKNKNVTSRI